LQTLRIASSNNGTNLELMVVKGGWKVLE